MKILLNIKGSLVQIEGKTEFNFKKERKDIAELLRELKNGKDLSMFFPLTIASNVKKLLVENGFITNDQGVTTVGEEFIKYPYKEEKENGLFTFDLFEFFNNHNMPRSLVVKCTRDLTEEDPQNVYLENYIYNDSEFILGNNEKGVYKEIQNIESYKALNKKDCEICFDYSNKTYNYLNRDLKMGEDLINDIRTMIISTVQSNTNYDIDYSDFVINLDTLSDFTNKELLTGQIDKKIIGNVVLEAIPFRITKITTAYKYIYFLMYERIRNGEYLSISEMNDVFYNEIITMDIFDESIRNRLHSFKFTLNDFSKYLTQSQFEHIQYKIRVIETLLDIDDFDDKYSINDVKDYSELFDFLDEKINFQRVSKAYLVTGYALAKNSKNKIIDCMNTFLKYVNNIEIIDTHPSNLKVNETIQSDLKNMGIKVTPIQKIREYFHDRYLVLELNDNSVEYWLITNEIGEFFNLETNQAKGTIVPYNAGSLVRNGTSLLELIKGGK